MGLSKKIKDIKMPSGVSPKVKDGEFKPGPGWRVIFAGGGTGGHLFPGIAIAEEFISQYRDSRILFISSGRPIEETVLSKTAFEKAIIRVEGIKGKSLWSKLNSLFILPKGLISAMGLLVKFKPDVVIGMGGYSAGPVIVASWVLRAPRVICEQNKLPGVTNRILAHFSNRIYVSFRDTKLKAPAEKLVISGNPVRKDIINRLLKGSEKENKESSEKMRFNVLILGGSQGAHGLNMAVIDAIGHLKDPQIFHFIHQSGISDEDVVRKAYQEKHISYVAQAFFEDMASLYQDADLIVCRSGATTIAEVTIAGRAVIFVPFPHATDNHQVFNAKPLVEDGAAEMILESELSGKLLSERIEFYADHPDIIGQMQQKIKAFAKPDAAKRIVDDICLLFGKREYKMSCAA